MKICFMGSMDFAAIILEKLHQTYGVDLVVTQPDRPVGRKRKLKGTPVKDKALELDLDIFQPNNIKKDHQPIIDASFDFIIVAAYGQMIPKNILDHGRFPAINVHASLLPKYRGGSPMHRAIINGDDFTGVSIMYMAMKMDAGPVLSQARLRIEDSDNVETIERKLADKGAKLLVQTMEALLTSSVEPLGQDEDKVTYAYHIKPEEKIIDINQPARTCWNKVRGLYPWPIAELMVKDHAFKIFKAGYLKENLSERVGEIVRIDKHGVYIQTWDGVFVLKVLQLKGKKKMPIQAFMNGLGRHIFVLGETI
ncbi:MAG TPA: methionyl-tRNA formyltransferase [Candidatus Izemoplasmatales bacterium]|nr:methionyl-tRNA formyltransferase [Candidatus Izemoplasmatales bacterium]